MQQSSSRFARLVRFTSGAAIALSLLAAPAAQARTAPRQPTPKAVAANVDLNRYAGQWFEIVSPKWSATGYCNDAVDFYTVNVNAAQSAPLTSLAALHTCTRAGLEIHRADGNLYAPNPAEMGRLVLEAKSTLGRPNLTHYDVIDLDPDYQWAVVSDDARQYFWILSRTPDLDVDSLQGIKDRLIASPDNHAFSKTLRCVKQSAATTNNCKVVLGL